MNDNELEIAKKHLLLPEDVTFRIIASKFMIDGNYRDLIVDTYDAKIYSGSDVDIILSCQMLYYAKYSDAPTFETLNALITRYCETRESVDITRLKITLDQIQKNKDEFNQDVVQDSVVDLITSKITYHAIIDNFEIIKTKKDVSKLLSALEKVSSISLDYDLGFLYFEHIIDHIEDLKKPELKIPLGFSEMDYVLNGGLYSDGKCLCLFLAPTHVGKSLMLSNIAVNMLRDNKFVVIVSLEMSEFVYGTRIDAHLADLDINSLPQVTDELETRIVDFSKLYPEAKLAIKEYAPNSINTNNIRNYLERLQKKYDRKLDAVFIDYVSLLNPIHGLNRGTYEKVGDVVKELRALSYYFACPVLSAVQSNRDGFSGSDLDMGNVSDSIEVARSADVMFTLYQLDGDREMSKLRSKVVKNRLGGMIGEIIEFNIDYNTLRIYDVSTENQGIASEAADIVSSINDDIINTL